MLIGKCIAQTYHQYLKIEYRTLGIEIKKASKKYSVPNVQDSIFRKQMLPKICSPIAQGASQYK